MRNLLIHLPVEISEQVLSQLQGKDLFRCLQVSKTWRYLANREHLWKKHCLDLGMRSKDIECKDEKYSYDIMTLCKGAKTWLSRWRVITSWRNFRFNLLNWPRHEDPKAYSIYQNRLAVRTESKIHIYLIKEEGTLKVDTINLPWNCFFEFRLMAINSKYIIVGFNNVILVYELNNTYSMKFAYTFNEGAAMATSDMYDFIEAGRNTFFVNILKIVKLSGDSLWVKVKYLYFHATYFQIDLRTGVAKNMFPYRNVKYLCGGDDVLMFREEEDEVLVLSTRDADLLCELTVGRFYSLSGNDKVIAVATDQGLSTFEIASGKNLTHISTPKFSKYITVNPLFDVVYSIHEDCETRKDIFSSYSMWNGKKLWSRVLQVKIPEFFRLNAVTLSVLYGKFIIIRTGGTDPPFIEDDYIHHNREYYVFDASSGEMLYRKEYDKFLLYTELYLCDKKYLRAAA